MKVKILVKYPQRLQVYIPEKAIYWQELIKTIKGAMQHAPDHWSIFYHPYALNQLKKRYSDVLILDFDSKKYPPFQFPSKPKAPPKEEAIPRYVSALEALENWIVVKRYSYATLKSYKYHFKQFLLYYNDTHPKDITDDQILAFMRHLIKEKSIAESTQNQAINAIKCYYEKVLKLPRKVYYLDRPKKPQSLPEVLSPEEVARILKAPRNLKHRLILMIVYSAGLRLSEVVRLRLEDLRLDQKKIFIKFGRIRNLVF